MKIRVENDTLVRDSQSNAILETDLSKLNRHKAVKLALKQKEQQIDSLIDRINKLETLVERIADVNNNL